MIGCYDFCGHYAWTFSYLFNKGGIELLNEYWVEAIGQDSQKHAASLIKESGFEGMQKYWGHTLAEEAAEYRSVRSDGVFRIDMFRCPSLGFLIKNNLKFYKDYCDHCIAWIGSVMTEAGFTIDHEHNHKGLCWWEIRKNSASPQAAPAQCRKKIFDSNDVRAKAQWNQSDKIDVFTDAAGIKDKEK